MPNSEDKKSADREKKLDEANEQTFPASDPARHARPTSTEPPARPQDRQAPVPSTEEIEAARKGDGHKHQGGS